MTRWIDVHTHLNMLEVSPQEALARAKAAGVERLITIGTQPEDHQLVQDIAKDLGAEVYCTLGVHPHDASKYSDEVGESIRQSLSNPQVVAVAEIGLDYYYDMSPREVQKEAFERQLQIALDTQMPVEIHTRDAEEDTVAILKNFSGKIKGLMHCFTGTQWLADECLKLGLNISFSGVVTFRNADPLREVCRSVPLDRLHVETDAPFLAPVPQRGKKNEPAFVVHTAELVSQLKGVSPSELADQTRANALRLFPRIDWE
ncbi:MAG: TatD family hydrolase [Bdellovibrionaceae bacterium]|nr:TatD family hydrolase [Bdellovibrionales bacterium]MCB9085831.1 TatD family hydrolase [Pseudobdellovibrionaceae bacterium]